MAGLIDMQQYVWTTAKVLSSVLDKEVVICDNDGNIIGDSIYDSLEDFKVHKMTEGSILIQSMKSRQVIRRYSVKNTVRSCLTCKKKDNCDINSIIAYPIICGDEVIGAIGLYSKYEEFHKAKSEEDFFNAFLEKISELFVSKAEENRHNAILTMTKRRLTNIIEHMDLAVCSMDEDNRVSFCNKKFMEAFRLRKSEDISAKEIETLLQNPKFQRLIESGEPQVSADLHFTVGQRKIYAYTTINKFYLNTGEYAGAIVYLKPMDKYLKEYDRLSSLSATIYFDDIIGESRILKETKEQAYRFAQNNSSILLLGESGTGKELFARAIHNAGRRREKPFVTVNCAAIPDNLLESELFGYEEGAFTGSIKGGKIGKFQLADRGTLFLDEIGELPIHLQAKLLRALQEKRISKIGGNAEIEVDIRIIAATNRNLEQMVESGEFREDLYYRLSVAPLKIPSLRERRSDIGLLAKYFVERCRKDMDKELEGLSREAMSALLDHDWPGNVRELQNAIEFAANMADTPIIERGDLPKRITGRRESAFDETKILPLREVEQYYIRRALNYYGEDSKGKEMAAEALGIGIATLYRKIKDKEKEK